MTTEKESKRRKVVGGTHNGDIIKVNDSCSVVVGQVFMTREERGFQSFRVPKRSVFLEALKTTSDQKVTISELHFEHVSKPVVTAFKLKYWELELGMVADLNIYYGNNTSMVVSCQLQFLSRGKVKRNGHVATEKEGKPYRTLIDPTKYQCLSFSFSLNLWVETIDEIRVILTFPSPISPVVNEVDGNHSYVPYLPFRPYFLSLELSDISVSCANETFPAHKMVLAHCSEVFKRMVQTPMKEIQERIIKLDAFDPPVVKEILRFVYTGKLEATPDIASEIFKVADTYAIKGLKEHIISVIVNTITLENAPRMYSFGELYNANAIMTQALSIAKASKKRLVPDAKTLKTLTDTHPNFMLKLCIQE